MRTDSDSVVSALFDRGGARAIFDHARNTVVATIIVAAGLESMQRLNAAKIFVLLNPLFVGYVVAGAGFALIALNFIDGLRKLARLRWHVLLQALLSTAYVFVSFRIIQLVILLRTGSC